MLYFGREIDGCSNDDNYVVVLLAGGVLEFKVSLLIGAE